MIYFVKNQKVLIIFDINNLLSNLTCSKISLCRSTTLVNNQSKLSYLPERAIWNPAPLPLLQTRSDLPSASKSPVNNSSSSQNPMKFGSSTGACIMKKRRKYLFYQCQSGLCEYIFTVYVNNRSSDLSIIASYELAKNSFLVQMNAIFSKIFPRCSHCQVENILKIVQKNKEFQVETR